MNLFLFLILTSFTIATNLQIYIHLIKQTELQEKQLWHIGLKGTKSLVLNNSTAVCTELAAGLQETGKQWVEKIKQWIEKHNHCTCGKQWTMTRIPEHLWNLLKVLICSITITIFDLFFQNYLGSRHLAAVSKLSRCSPCTNLTLS